MKRLILAAVLAISLGVLVGASVQVFTTGGSPDGPRAAGAMPYPRTTSPLPVPEVVIGQKPWRDPFPSAVPARPELAKGFMVRCTAGDGVSAEPDACRALPSMGAP